MLAAVAVVAMWLSRPPQRPTDAINGGERIKLSVTVSIVHQTTHFNPFVHALWGLGEKGEGAREVELPGLLMGTNYETVDIWN